MDEKIRIKIKIRNKKQEKRQGNANYITCRIRNKKNVRGMQTTLHVEKLTKTKPLYQLNLNPMYLLLLQKKILSYRTFFHRSVSILPIVCTKRG